MVLNTKIKNGVIWIAVTIGIFWVIQFSLKIFLVFFSSGFNLRLQPMGSPNFGPHHGMEGPHHGGDFSWIAILLLLAVVFAVSTFLWKVLKKKRNTDSFQQFVLGKNVFISFLEVVV